MGSPRLYHASVQLHGEPGDHAPGTQGPARPADGPTPSLGLVLAPFAAGYCLSYLFRTVNAVIAPELTRELGLGPSELGFLTSTYFLTFALAQLPVGIALDRWGPRRVTAALLLVAAAGAALFATGTSLVALSVGRGLIGLGVSACLMGGLKAIGHHFPLHRQASLTGIIMSAGAFGALTTSSPLAWVLPWLGWRGALAVVAVVSVVVAIVIAALVPKEIASPKSGAAAEPTPTRELHVYAEIARSPSFWRYAAQAGLYTGGFMALQGLWAGPFLMTVSGRTRAEAAAMLLLLNLGMFAGQLSIAAGAGWLARAGISRRRLMSTGLGIALLIEAVIVLSGGGSGAAWFALGFTSATSAQVYGVAAGHFRPEFWGRVSTAVNAFAFIGAFAVQWGVGAAIEQLSTTTTTPLAFQAALALLWMLQVGGVVATMFGESREDREG